MVYGGRKGDEVLYDGIVIDISKKSVISYFRQPEMPLFSVIPGQITE